MWVSITAVEGGILIGRLENTPSDMPQLRLGSPITFRRYSVIDIEWNEHRKISPPSSPTRRWYWDRCLVDCCVTEDGVAVEYLYRETPDMSDDDDDHADSGWRIRGDARGVEDADFDRREAALGRVLNADDSWLSLIDAPIGSAFLRNWQSGTFERVERLT
jgi:hypothetical protein